MQHIGNLARSGNLNHSVVCDVDSSAHSYNGLPSDAVPPDTAVVLLDTLLIMLLHHKVGGQTKENGLENASRDGMLLGSPQLPTQAVDTLLREDL